VKKKRLHSRLPRAGYSLLELVIASSLSAVLMAGLAASVQIASQSLDVATGSSTTSREAQQAINQIHEDLQSALDISDLQASSVTFLVPDRDGDGLPELMLYAWGGTAGDPLTCEIDYSDTNQSDTTTVIAKNVQAFQFHKYLIAPQSSP
jgi:prepilin-type N-terminal cleavage/methylation domain-containing protein